MISHLEVHAPSATTIEYTVSNKRHPASKTWTAARHGIRAIVVAHLVLLNLLKADTLIVLGGSNGFSKLSPVSLMVPVFRHISPKADWPTLAVANVIILYLCLRRYYIGKRASPFNLTYNRSPPRRRIATCSSGARYSDFDHFTILFFKPYDYFHTDDQNPGHRHS